MQTRQATRLRGDTSALAQVVSLAVAAAIVLVSIAAILLASQGASEDGGSARGAAQDVEAGSLADLLVGSPGVGWAAGPDQIGRLGLGAYNGSGLQQSSIDALKGAMFERTANGKVDYDDAKQSLGLSGSQDFHIRMYPVATSLLYDTSLAGTRIAYVADWTPFGTVKTALGTPLGELGKQANLELNKTMAANTVSERQVLSGLGASFHDRVYISTLPAIAVDLPAPLIDPPLLTYLGVPFLEGDVYPDIKAYLDLVLAGRLSQYDVLVIGSGVDHNSLTSNAVKFAIRDWVLAGGTLVVLGSSSQNFQWIQPLFSLGVATANGAPTAPDVSHPLLKEPNELDWTHYDNKGLTWDIKDSGSNANYDSFIHVVQQGGKDVFAVSKDGAFGEGRIILTTYQPRDVAQTLGMQEAYHFMQNIALYADRVNLFLEYGPTAPPDTPVSVAVRQSWLWDERLGQVPVRLEIQTWA